jgi:polyhydroxyalkanoate synthase subunit PhaC
MSDLVPGFLREPYRRFLEGAEALQSSHNFPVGLSPREEIWALNKARLYRYTPTRPAEERKKTPLLLVYSLINRPYIFDLRPGRSFIEYMVEQGYDLYLLDWGVPGPEDRNTTFDDYLAQYLPRAVRRVLATSGAPKLNLLGYCIGATQTTIYAALHPEQIKNLVLLTAPLDFAEKGTFGTWLDPKHFNIDRFVDSLGNVPPAMVEFGSKLLKPMENFLGTYLGLWDKLDDEASVEGWQAMDRWVHDGVPFAGEAFRQWVRDYIQENKLIKGELVISGQKIDLKKISAPLLNVIADGDHIVPNGQSLSIMEKVSSADKTLEKIPAGHVGLMIGRNARNNLWPKISRWLGERD